MGMRVESDFRTGWLDVNQGWHTRLSSFTSLVLAGLLTRGLVLSQKITDFFLSHAVRQDVFVGKQLNPTLRTVPMESA